MFFFPAAWWEALGMVVAANRVARDPLGGGLQEWITALCLSLDPLGRGL